MTAIPQFNWSQWISLSGAQVNPISPTVPGVYRIRDSSTQVILYVGETGNLRKRFSDLQYALKEEIPYADPHTATPALWAYRQTVKNPLEISFVEVPGDRPSRLVIETTYIAIIRAESNESPLANFGQMPDGWIKSSGNSKKLRDAGKKFRGYADSDAMRTPSIESVLDCIDSPMTTSWLKFNWSEWQSFPDELPPTETTGLYRIRREGENTLSYIGQGQIAARIASHAKKSEDLRHPQAKAFAPGFLFSWVEINMKHRRQLLELEADLIASHFVSLNAAPTAQFKG